MSAGYRMSVTHLVEMMLAGVGQRGSEDLKYHWFETIYGIIREQPWPWNWKNVRANTYAELVSTEGYTWTQGSTTLQGDAALSFLKQHTGRKIDIDGIPYTVTEVAAGNQLIVDAPLHIAQSTAASLTFYRTDYLVKTSSLWNIEVDGYKCVSTSPHFWKKAYGEKNIAWGSAAPTEYELKEDVTLSAPLYGIKVAGVTNPGNIEDGTYEYFVTRYDKESGLESPPGPKVQLTYSIGGARQSIQYDNPDGNIAESGSYYFRLWRSKVSPSGERYPAWLVAERTDVNNALVYWEDNLSDAQLIAQERYYGGNSTLIEWHLWPDDVYPIRIRCMDDYGGRPDPNDVVDVGRNNIVNELLALGASVFVELANRDVAGQQAAIAKFRTQLAYLVKKVQPANADDDGHEQLVFNDGIPDSQSYFDPSDPVPSYKWHY